MRTACCNNKCTLKRILAVILLGIIAAGCSPDKPVVETPASSGKIIIRGSNTIGEELAPQLVAEYKKAHPAAAFDLEAKGTAYAWAR